MDTYHEMSSVFHQRLRRNLDKRIIPVTLVGGFLGAGKTTAVNHILQQPSEIRTDVMIREFDEVSIDDQLLAVSDDRVHPQPGVSMHIDEETMLYVALDRLHEERYGEFDRLLLETSGMESPELFLHLFFLWDMPSRYKLLDLITLVDAEYGELNLDQFKAAVEQVAVADVIAINKTDLADETSLTSLEARLRRINPMARIMRTTYGKIDPDTLSGTPLYEQLRVLPYPEPAGGENMDGITSYAISIDQPLDKAKVNVWINKLFTEYGDKLLRSKGFLNFAGEDYRYEFQAVRKTFRSYAHDKWADGDERRTVIVLIGTELPDKQELENTLRACI